MVKRLIDWALGGGSCITVVFDGGDGDGSISVSSDENESYVTREQALIVRTTTGNPEQMQTLLVKQEGKSLASGAVDENGYIIFADPEVERICVTNWGDGEGITLEQAAVVTGIGTVFFVV